MKKLSVILSGIAFAGVAVLFILYFSQPQQEAGKTTTKAEEDSLTSKKEMRQQPIQGKKTTNLGENLNVAFVKIDTVLNNYLYYENLRNDFQEKQQNIQSELDTKTQRFKSEAKKLRKKFDKGLITRSKAQKKQQQLQRQQQNLMQKRQKKTQQLSEERKVMMRKVLYRIKQYLKDYQKHNNYHMILSTSFGDNILYGDDRLDITQEVIDSLNQQYRSKQQSQE